MPRLLGAGFESAANEVAEKLDLLVRSLSLLRHETVGVFAEPSKDGILLLYACMKAGLKIALCPLREPPFAIRNWLNTLHIKTLLWAGSPWHEFIIEFNCLTVTRLLDNKLESAAQGHLRYSNFSSIIRTSGTTGMPKSALISQRAHMASAQGVNKFFGLSSNDVWALNLPLYHVSGLSILFRCAAADASIYIAQTLDDLVAGLKESKITHVSLVPLQFKRLLDMGAPLHSLKAIIIGGDALPENLRQKAGQLRLPIYETYGLTETASMVWVRENLSEGAGQVLSHAMMTLGEDGEILVGGESLFSGYVDEPRVDPKGLFETGDLSADLFSSHLPLVKGRKNNRIITGGFNVQAEEVERVLEEHPHVETCIVVGVEDSYYGMRLVAYIKWLGNTFPRNELPAYLRAELPPYKIPKFFLPWPEFAPIGIKKPRAWFSQFVKATGPVF